MQHQFKEEESRLQGYAGQRMAAAHVPPAKATEMALPRPLVWAGFAVIAISLYFAGTWLFNTRGGPFGSAGQVLDGEHRAWTQHFKSSAGNRMYDFDEIQGTGPLADRPVTIPNQFWGVTWSTTEASGTGKLRLIFSNEHGQHAEEITVTPVGSVQNEGLTASSKPFQLAPGQYTLRVESDIPWQISLIKQREPGDAPRARNEAN